jgi:hypothetical protein
VSADAVKLLELGLVLAAVLGWGAWELRGLRRDRERGPGTDGRRARGDASARDADERGSRR